MNGERGTVHPSQLFRVQSRGVDSITISVKQHLSGQSGAAHKTGLSTISCCGQDMSRNGMIFTVGTITTAAQ